MGIFRKFSSIYNTIKEYITDDDRQPEADTSVGNVSRDIFLDYPANEFEEHYEDIDEVKNYSSLNNVDLMSSDGISNFALNFSVVRSEATKATGTVTFYKTTAPTHYILIPINSVIETKTKSDGTKIQYRTTANASMGTNTVRDSNTGKWGVDVEVEALVEGTASNVGKNALTIMNPLISEINSVTNRLAIADGTDQETAESLATRILEATSYDNIGTATGYEEIVLAFNSDILDVNVVGSGDDEMKRDMYGGTIDVYILGENEQSFSRNYTFRQGDTFTYIDGSQPVMSISSIVGLTSGQTFTVDTDYTFSQDTTWQSYGFSYRAWDRVVWTGVNDPWANSQITVSGTYDKMVRDTQAFLDDPIRRIVATDLLVKKMIRTPVTVQISVGAHAGFNKTQVQTDIENALIEGLTNYGAGDDVEQADLVQIIYDSSEAVDIVTLPFTALYETSGASGSDDIGIAKNEYARIDDSTLSVTVT